MWEDSSVKGSGSCHPAVLQSSRELVPQHSVNTQFKLSHSRGWEKLWVWCSVGARAKRAAEGKPLKPLMSL